MTGASKYEHCSIWHCNSCGEHLGIFKDELINCPKCKENLRYINEEQDEYFLMAKFMVDNQIEKCNICHAIMLFNDNKVCDNQSFCIIGIADYLREHKVLELE